MNYKITGCIFDLDGTLADTAPDIAAALNFALQESELKKIPLEIIIRMIGNGIPKLVTSALTYLGASPVKAEDVLCSMLLHYQNNYCDKSFLMNGVEDCLSELFSRDIPMAICTNKEENLANMIVRALGIEEYFTVVVGSRPNQKKKPDRAMLDLAAAIINSPNSTTMMIGDSEVDAQAAIAAECIPVIVRGGYCHKPYHELGVPHVIADMASLPKLIAETGK